MAAAEAPLVGEAGGASDFPCSSLLSTATVQLLGTGPRCWWRTRRLGAVALGREPGLVPGSGVEVTAVGRYAFGPVAATQRQADVRGGGTAPVPWPLPVISGPQLVAACADAVTLGSGNSQGLAGRMALPRRWSIEKAFNVTNGSWDGQEVLRAQEGLASNAAR